MAAPSGTTTAAETHSSSSGQLALALIVATVLGAGGGGFLGFTLTGDPSTAAKPAEPAPAESAAPKKSAESADKGHGAQGHGGQAHGGHGAAAPNEGAKDAPQAKMKLKELAPIVTNLALPETGWVRLQASIVYDSQAVPQPDILISQVTADIVAFLRTMTLSSLEGSDGLRRLHEDLTDRAATRSEGHIQEVIIQALVVQ
ncbi:flagellar basal body-associated protein FliL [Methylosinus sp. R-45379]|uniref:flagellar basal body-associated FliL family protein n=1 Tax=unclassified Methylosinus TaxID=2624500 RepID=UPI0004635F8B|nr:MULTISPECIES: flagellar basal body-associated FliL family protein [unclassified Methylosinus]OAI29594.1 flagellar basal body-associated protein FliL [Methylosinus sp. R-45379]